MNVGKTQAIVVGGAHHPTPLKLQDTDDEWSPQVKYLGVTIGSRLTMGPDVNHAIGKSRAVRALLYLNVGVYKLYIHPLLNYEDDETNKSRIRAQQSLSLHKIATAPRFVRNTTIQRNFQVESLDDFVGRLATSMFARADASAWPHIKHIAPCHTRPPDRRRLPRDLIVADDGGPNPPD